MALMIADLPLLLARRRGLGNLIEGLYNGDPWAWTIAIGLGVIFVGIPVAKHFMANNEQGSGEVAADNDAGGGDSD